MQLTGHMLERPTLFIYDVFGTQQVTNAHPGSGQDARILAGTQIGRWSFASLLPASPEGGCAQRHSMGAWRLGLPLLN